MNTMADTKNLAKNLAVGSKVRMTPSEAFVETLVAQGVKDSFGIVGSAYMDAHDLFPLAGIRFISVAHEQNAAHMADGYSRVSGKHGVCIAQNGPGITKLRHGHCSRLLGAFTGSGDHSGVGQSYHGSRRVPGNRADAHFLQDYQVASAR
jgi:hypothetical protein